MPEVFLRTFTEIEYIGSFPVTISDIATRAEYIRLQINELRANARTIPVRLVISLSGIKICSPDGKHVLMAHALRRISYATYDPNNAQFSFVAREPHGHCNFQYCHTFLGQSSEQVSDGLGLSPPMERDAEEGSIYVKSPQPRHENSSCLLLYTDDRYPPHGP